MNISTDLEAIAAIETLKSYLTEAQKDLEDKFYRQSLDMIYRTEEQRANIQQYLIKKKLGHI